jgi:transposase InsO family protein
VAYNGSSFIARRFQTHVKPTFEHVRIAYRTPTQLGLIERFHRTLKKEEVYWRVYDIPAHARVCLAELRQRFNERRPHWALIPEGGGDPLMPKDVCLHGLATRLSKRQGWAKQAEEQLDQLMSPAAA